MITPTEVLTIKTAYRLPTLFLGTGELGSQVSTNQKRERIVFSLLIG